MNFFMEERRIQTVAMLRHSSCFLHTLDFAVFLFLSAGAYATTSRFCASAAKHSLLRTSAAQAGMTNESQWNQCLQGF